MGGAPPTSLLRRPERGGRRRSNLAPTREIGKVYDHGCNLTNPSSLPTWNSCQKMNGFEILVEGNNVGVSHCSTVERLYAWEKKLFQEVKEAESIKIEHEKKVGLARKLEVKRGDYVKTEKTKKEVEKLESQMTVAAQAIRLLLLKSSS